MANVCLASSLGRLQVGFKVWEEDQNVFKCWDIMWDVIWHGELGSSLAILNAGTAAGEAGRVYTNAREPGEELVARRRVCAAGAEVGGTGRLGRKRSFAGAQDRKGCIHFDGSLCACCMHGVGLCRFLFDTASCC